ncbi:hypothetical protein V8E54_014655 [Elaphomyces granulatus]
MECSEEEQENKGAESKIFQAEAHNHRPFSTFRASSGTHAASSNTKKRKIRPTSQDEDLEGSNIQSECSNIVQDEDFGVHSPERTKLPMQLKGLLEDQPVSLSFWALVRIITEEIKSDVLSSLRDSSQFIPVMLSRGSSDLNLSPIFNYAFDVSSGNSDLNSSLIFNYAFDVSRGNSDLNSSSVFNYAFDISRGNSDLNSSLIFNYTFDVSLRVDFTNTFL